MSMSQVQQYKEAEERSAHKIEKARCAVSYNFDYGQYVMWLPQASNLGPITKVGYNALLANKQAKSSARPQYDDVKAYPNVVHAMDAVIQNTVGFRKGEMAVVLAGAGVGTQYKTALVHTLPNIIPDHHKGKPAMLDLSLNGTLGLSL